MITKIGQQYKEAILGIGTLGKGIWEGLHSGSWKGFKEAVGKAYNDKMGPILRCDRGIAETRTEMEKRIAKEKSDKLIADNEARLLREAEKNAQGVLTNPRQRYAQFTKKQLELLMNKRVQDALDIAKRKTPWKAMAGTAGATSLGWYMLGPNGEPSYQ